MDFLHTSPAIGVMSLALLLSACGDPFEEDVRIPPPEEPVAESSVPSTRLTDCPAVNTDPADTSVTYTNAERGIRFTIPYNEKWGSAVQSFPPFIDYPADEFYPYGYVMFGPPTPNLGPDPELCAPSRAYEMTYLPARTAADTERAVKDGRTEVVPNTTRRTINGLTVVQYTDVGLCNFPTMEVIGTQFNYSFTTGCGTDEEGEWEYLESIINTVQLTK